MWACSGHWGCHAKLPTADRPHARLQPPPSAAFDSFRSTRRSCRIANVLRTFARSDGRLSVHRATFDFRISHLRSVGASPNRLRSRLAVIPSPFQRAREIGSSRLLLLSYSLVRSPMLSYTSVSSRIGLFIHTFILHHHPAFSDNRTYLWYTQSALHTHRYLNTFSPIAFPDCLTALRRVPGSPPHRHHSPPTTRMPGHDHVSSDSMRPWRVCMRGVMHLSIHVDYRLHPNICERV